MYLDKGLEMTSMGGPRELKPEPPALAEVQRSAHSARYLVFLLRQLLSFLKSSPSSEQSVCFPWILS